MRELETDYLVIGAGATGMSFVDALLEAPDTDVVMVDRRHRPGGHWLDAYPFVRLHQPSANYGVASRPLGFDRIDESGPNAGFYERASAAEICDYFARVMDERFIASGRVRFLGASDYRGEDADGHHVASLLTGDETVVKVRRRFVDATYLESSIPSRHTPSFGVDADARFIPPNDLVNLGEPARGFTVFGAGKTAMDTCVWLLDNGVDPNVIRWFRPREPWLFTRASFQPLALVGSYMGLQAAWVAAAAQAADGMEFALRMEAEGVFTRVDPTVDATMFRGAITSEREIAQLRSIERVVRGARVLHVGTLGIKTDQGDMPMDPETVVVDCTAAGVRPVVQRPIFEPGKITPQLVTIGVGPWSAATLGVVEVLKADEPDSIKNQLCPPLTFDGTTDGIMKLAFAGMSGLLARGADPAVSAWNDSCRLNVAAAARDHLDDPRVTAAFGRIAEHIGPAMENLARFA